MKIICINAIQIICGVQGGAYALYFLRECLFVFRTCEGCDTSCESTVSGISVESIACISVDSKRGSSGAYRLY